MLEEREGKNVRTLCVMRSLLIRLICKAQNLIGRTVDAKPYAVALSTNQMRDVVIVLLNHICVLLGLSLA